MSLPWEQHWITTWLARRELASLAPDLLVRALLIVGVGEFLAMVLFSFLRVRMGLWAAVLDVLLLTLLTCVPLYMLVLRPAARLAARVATASAEAHYQAVVEAVTDAILVTDAAGTILFGNPAVQTTFGYDFQDVLGRPLTELLPPRPASALVAQAVGAAAVPVPPEAEGCRRDGSRFPAEVASRPVEIGGRELRVTVVRDISRRREAERELERLASFPRLNPNPILECEADGRITYANPAALRWLQELGGGEPAARLLPSPLPERLRACLEARNDRCLYETHAGAKWLLWWFHPLPDGRRVRIYGTDITERKQAEEKMAYQARLLANVNDAVIATDERFVITAWNRAAAAIYGWKAEEVLGRRLQEVLRTEPWGEEKWMAPGLLERTGSFSGEVVEYHKDGTPRVIEANAFSVKDEEGRLTGYASVNRDVTARKRAAEKLRESEERYRTLAEAAPDAIFMIDRAGEFEYVNSYAARRLGLPAEQAVGKRPADLFGASLSEKRQQDLVAVMETGRALYAEDELAFPEGKRWVGTWLTPIRGDAGEVRSILGIARDITARKRAEQELAERTAYLNTLITHSPLAIVALDAEHRVRLVNPAFERLYGYHSSELVGRDPDELISGPEERNEARGITRRLLEGEAITAVTRRRRKDGTLVDVELNAVPLLVEGKKVGVYGIYEDITERKRAEEKLRESEERFRLLVDALPVAVRVVQAGRLRFTNPAGAVLFGYSRPEELQEMSAFEHVAAADLPRLREYMEERAAGEAVPAGYEYRARRRDGAEFPAEGMVARITFKGQPASLIVLRDLTERKRLHLFESLLPVCCECGKVRDDTKAPRGRGPWKALEQYVVEHSDADLTHTFCPDCYRAYREREGLPPAEPPVE